MGNTVYFQWEADLMIALQAFLGDVGGKIASFVSVFGEELIMIGVLGFLYWCYDKKLGVKFGYNMIFIAVSFPLLKNIALRRRPYMDIEGITCLRPVDKGADVMDITAQGYSFPSGHSANSTALYGSLAYYFNNKVLRIICSIIPILVGIARVCLGNHFPTDVMAGWLLGCIAVFGIPQILKRCTGKHKALVYLIIFLVCCGGFFFCDSNDYFTGLGMMGGLFAGNLFEEKYVNFENTKDPLLCILRIAGGGAIYAVLNTVMKLPFSEEFLLSASIGQFAFRAFRYILILFIDLAVYPMVFRKFEPWFNAKFRRGKIDEKA